MVKGEGSVRLGPCAVPRLPYKDFSAAKISRDEEYGLWRIIGPTVERNLNQPLWRQFVIVYMQGIQNGAAAMRERHDQPARD
jgi:hypothetical protein